MKTALTKLLEQLNTAESENASCTLASFGPQIAGVLYEHFHRSDSPKVRQTIVEIINGFRRQDDLPFFAKALNDASESVWQAAIDALVSQPSPASVMALIAQAESESKSSTPNAKRLSFIEEAIAELKSSTPFGIVKS